MTESDTNESRRVLRPSERFSEILFGLIMVLSFTCSLSVAEAGRENVRTMLIGAIGCNLAWGLIDAILYLINTYAERGHGLLTLRRVRQTTDRQKARHMIAEALPGVVADILTPAELESIHDRLNQLPEPPASARFQRKDWVGAVGVFLLVFLSTFPVMIPFVVMAEAGRALRVSNLIATVLVFVCAYRLGQRVGARPWLMGGVMVALCGVLVAITIALGG